MSYAGLQQAIWILGTALHVYLVSLVALRKLYRLLPIFSAYLCFILAKNIVLWAMHLKSARTWYYLTYWTGETIAFTLGFLITIELFSRLLVAYPSVAAFCRTVLVVVLGVLVISCFALARLDPDALRSTFGLLERSVRYVQVGLIVCFFTMAAYFRLSLHPWQRAIALGYGLYAAVELANYALFLHFHAGYERLGALATMIAYNIARVVWSYSLTVPVRIPAVQAAIPAPELVALEAEIRNRMEEINRALWGVLRGRAS